MDGAEFIAPSGRVRGPKKVGLDFSRGQMGKKT